MRSTSLLRRGALGFAALLLACNAPPSAPSGEAKPSPEAAAAKAPQTSAETPVDAPPSEPTVTQTNASWPKGCLIENAAFHPTKPWLAVACTNSEAEQGAVLVFDLQAGSLRATATTHGYVGWSDPGLLRWHPDGRKLVTNVDTNGLALLHDMKWVGRAYPDETRDSGVGYFWLGDELFTDTGAQFQISAGEDRFDFDTVELPLNFQDFEYDADKGLVVGRIKSGVGGYDLKAKRMVFELSLSEYGDSGSPRWSPDGKWAVRRKWAVHPASDELIFVSSDTGAVVGLERPSSPRIGKLAWSPASSLAVSSHVHQIGGPSLERKVDVFRAGKRVSTIDLGEREIQASHSVAEASGMAWSPDSQGLGLLLDGQRVQVHDANTGERLVEFEARAPDIPEGLPEYVTRAHRPEYGFPGDLMWGPNQRLVRIADHFVAIWAMDGTKVAEFRVPVD